VNALRITGNTSNLKNSNEGLGALVMTTRISPKCMSEWRDRLLLFCGLLSLLGVTDADQGEEAPSLKEWL
jgi:hypothetical protein